MKKASYLPSIDSLRAIAVISVIIYHIDVNYLSGGFLGVDLFFVLSGYLISSLIIKDYRQTGSLNLWNFYIRRGRRLLPAVYFMITVVLIVMVVFNKYLLEKSHLDGLFGYIYTSNWWYIFHKLNYFDSFGAQSPFKHLWSLAIEEQFYMFFPLLFLVFNNGKLVKGQKFFRLNRNFKYIVLGLIGISLFIHIYLFDINNINRIYFGTDTRAFSLLVGVMGALLYPMGRLSRSESKETSIKYSIASILSIISFIVLMWFTSEYDSWLYHGGFLLVAVLALIVIITSGKQNTLMSKILSIKPLVYIGKISYSLYLWHFPILVLTTPVEEIGNTNLIYALARVLLIFIVASFSYYFVETPIRKLGFWNFISIISKQVFKLTTKLRRTIISVVAVFAVLFTMGIFGKSLPYISTAFVTEMDHSGAQQFVADGSSSQSSSDENSEAKSSDKNTSVEENSSSSTNSSDGKSSESNSSENKNTNEETKKDESKVYDKMIVIGDSLAVDIGADITAAYPGVIVDGKISRQLTAAIPVAQSYAKYNSEKTAVVFQLGTNGPFTESQLEELVNVFSKSDIYFVNVRVPRSWEKTVNNLLNSAKEKYSNVTVVDWYSVASQHTEYFAADKVHLQPTGSKVLVDLISKTLKHNVKITK